MWVLSMEMSEAENSAETSWSSLAVETNSPAVRRATCILPKVLTLVSVQDVLSWKLLHASTYVITNGKTPRANCSKNFQNLFQLWSKSYQMSFPEITNFRPAFHNQKFRRAAVNLPVYEMCTTGWSTFTKAVAPVFREKWLCFLVLSRQPNVCLSVCLNFESIPGHLLKERYRNTHSTASGETETDKTRKLSTRKEVLASRKLGYLRSRNRYPEEYEAHVHILLTNNFVQVYQASLRWAEGDNSVCSARMSYLPPLFRVTPREYEVY